jgi:hypothetical protein
MVEIINEISSEVKHEVKMGNKELEVINYKDGTVLVAQIEYDLQRLIYKLKLAGVKYNMKFSQNKTKSLTVSKELTGNRSKPVEQVIKLKIYKCKSTATID